MGGLSKNGETWYNIAIEEEQMSKGAEKESRHKQNST